MLFNSLHFLVFFPVVLVAFYVLPHRFRWAMLLVASYYFYMGWNPAYASLLLLTTTVDFFVARRIEDASRDVHRKVWLAVSLCLNLGLLLYFKYYDFFIENVNALTGSELAYSRFLLPVGISFYTFQEMGYVIDVYRRHLPAERHFGKFALFVSYFPQLVAGPIERATHLMHQLKQRVELRFENFSRGAQHMAWGFFKKVVIADNLAPVIDTIYADPGQMSGGWLLLASYFFAIQIYCDFSGYSDIAIGAARMMGVNLMENFRLPYLSASIREFWSRWHISLSTWFRDYLYIPLGGNRKGEWRTNVNLFAVFAISGFWHGANWTFIAWGVLHGGMLMVENLLKRFAWFANYLRRPSAWARWVGILVTGHIVLLGWIFFRAANIDEASLVISRIADWAPQASEVPENFLRLSREAMVFKIGLVGALLLADPWMYRMVKGEFDDLPRWFRRLVYACIIALVLLLGYWGETEFIYFQF